MQQFNGYTIIVTASCARPGRGSSRPIYTITRGGQHHEVVHQHVLLERFPTEEDARVAAYAAGRRWIQETLHLLEAGTESARHEPLAS